MVHCLQYKVEEYERQKGPLPWNEKVSDRLRDVRRVVSLPTPPAAPREDQYVSASG